MAKLNAIFKAPRVEKREKLDSPVVKFDYKTQFVKFRFLQDFDDLDVMMRHYVDGIGYVECNKTVKPEEDKNGEIVGLTDNPSGEHDKCVFCNRRSLFKKEMSQKIADEKRKPTKPESETMQNFMKRGVTFKAPVEYEVWEGKKIIKEKSAGVILFKIQDMLYDQLKQHYKTLKNIVDKKGTLLDHWFTMSGDGELLIDDKLDKDEKKALDYDEMLAFYDAQNKTYEQGLKKLLEKEGAVEEAEPYPEEKSSEPEEEIVEKIVEKKSKSATKKKASTDELDEEIPF